jgi:hypothetical protein
MIMKEPSAPEYYLDSFPRDSFPRYVWADKPPATLPPAAWTTETTHRDGQQGGLPLTTEQSLRIYDILCRFTGDSGAIRQAEFFVYRPSDKAALEGALERYKSGAPIEPTTWIRATASDVELVRSLGVRETGMLASASDRINPRLTYAYNVAALTPSRALASRAVRYRASAIPGPPFPNVLVSPDRPNIPCHSERSEESRLL